MANCEACHHTPDQWFFYQFMEFKDQRPVGLTVKVGLPEAYDIVPRLGPALSCQKRECAAFILNRMIDYLLENL